VFLAEFTEKSKNTNSIKNDNIEDKDIEIIFNNLNDFI
jgi:hypothetical protein